MTTYREWFTERLQNHPQLNAAMVGGFHSARGLVETPPRPFLAMVFSTETDELTDVATRQICRFWIHDDLESFTTIDQALEYLREALATPESEQDMLHCRFSENSQDFFDPGHGTVTRYGTYYATKVREGV